MCICVYVSLCLCVRVCALVCVRVCVQSSLYYHVHINEYSLTLSIGFRVCAGCSIMRVLVCNHTAAVSIDMDSMRSSSCVYFCR